MGVISLRLHDRDLARLDELSRKEHKSKANVARELLEYGWNSVMISHYKLGKLSLGGLARKLDISISETIDLLAENGVEAPIEFEDYLMGSEVLRNR